MISSIICCYLYYSKDQPLELSSSSHLPEFNPGPPHGHFCIPSYSDSEASPLMILIALENMGLTIKQRSELYPLGEMFKLCSSRGVRGAHNQKNVRSPIGASCVL